MFDQEQGRDPGKIAAPMDALRRGRSWRAQPRHDNKMPDSSCDLCAERNAVLGRLLRRSKHLGRRCTSLLLPCSPRRPSASIMLSLNARTASNMVPISSPHGSVGIAASRSPLARVCIDRVKAIIGCVILRPIAQNMVLMKSRMTASPTSRTVLANAACSTTSSWPVCVSAAKSLLSSSKKLIEAFLKGIQPLGCPLPG